MEIVTGNAFCSVAGVSACDAGMQLGCRGRTVSHWFICVMDEASFIAECLSHTCTHMLQRCTQEQHSMRKWSRRKRRTEVKAEGDGLCRVPGREV